MNETVFPEMTGFRAFTCTATTHVVKFHFIRYLHRQMEKQTKKKKNPAAVALGRLGGLKGGPALAKKLSAKERSESARRAVTVRWKKAKQQ